MTAKLSWPKGRRRRFFDRVNHDVLMERLSRRIADRRLIRVVRRYLEAGVMADGVIVERQEGTPQGGPLSPLLANVLLNEMDRELESRGHAFVRYAVTDQRHRDEPAGLVCLSPAAAAAVPRWFSPACA